MKPQRIMAMARKEFLHLWRDPRSLGLGIAIPMLLLFLFGYALTLDVDRVPFMVWDQSNTTESRELVSRFSGSRYFSLVGSCDSYHDIEKAIDRRDVLMALVIPADFSRNLRLGRPTMVQLILDGSDSNTATIALGYAESVTLTFSRQIIPQQLQRQGNVPRASSLELRPRVWYNDDMTSRNYIFPGLIALIMMVISALLTSLTVAREWESGTMEQLIATPLTGGELILGKLIPYFAIGALDIILSILVGEFIFQVPLRGSLLLLAGLSVLFLVVALSFGIMLSIVTKSQFLASQLALVTTMLPAFLLSGFVFPIANMPLPIQGVTHIISARYFVYLLRGVYMKSVGLKIMWGETLFLAFYGVVILVIARKKFRKRVE